jgi:hypothetical protein
MKTTKKINHKGPHPGIVAIIYMVLFITGLSFVSSFAPPYFPEPSASASTIVTYFQHHSHDVLMCGFFQFCSAIPLGIFTATVVSRLNFFGSNAAGNNIALFGGFLNAFSLAISSMIMWVMAYPGIAEDENVIRTLYYLMFVTGGVGFSVPLGLLIGGIVVPCWVMKTLPQWLRISGFVLALVGLLSSFYFISPRLLYLIPLTRFPGFIWLILVGFKLSYKRLAQVSD